MAFVDFYFLRKFGYKISYKSIIEYRGANVFYALPETPNILVERRTFVTNVERFRRLSKIIFRTYSIEYQFTDIRAEFVHCRISFFVRKAQNDPLIGSVLANGVTNAPKQEHSAFAKSEVPNAAKNTDHRTFR